MKVLKNLILNYIYISVILVIVIYSNLNICIANEFVIRLSHQIILNKFDIII